MGSNGSKGSTVMDAVINSEDEAYDTIQDARPVPRFLAVGKQGENFFVYGADEDSAWWILEQTGREAVSLEAAGVWNPETGMIENDPFDVTVEGDVWARPQRKAS